MAPVNYIPTDTIRIVSLRALIDRCLGWVKRQGLKFDQQALVCDAYVNVHNFAFLSAS